jgi:hypothetical protein
MKKITLKACNVSPRDNNLNVKMVVCQAVRICVLYIINRRFVLLACHSHNYPNVGQLKIYNVIYQYLRIQPFEKSTFGEVDAIMWS